MRKAYFLFLVGFFVVWAYHSFGTKEKFYIAEEMFLSGEYSKAKGLYRNVDTSSLSDYELQLLRYRLALLSRVEEGLKLLSNSSLPEAVSLREFLESYFYGNAKKIEDAIITRNEEVVFEILRDLDISKVTNVDTLLALKLYYSLSNFKVPKYIDSKVSEGDDFCKVKNLFIEYLMFRNLGESKRSEMVLEKIMKEYPNSFFAYLIKEAGVDSSKVGYTGTSTLKTSSGYYLTFQKSKVSDEILEDMRKEVNFSGYQLSVLEEKVYIGPFDDKSKAIQFGQNISEKYRVEMSLVRVSAR